MCHERYTAVVSTLRLVTFLEEYGNDRIFPLLLDFPLAPDECGELVEFQQDGPGFLKSKFQWFRGKAGRPDCFCVCHCLNHCDNLLLRRLILTALATGCCGSLFRISKSSMSNLAFSSERKNRTHLSWIGRFLRSTLLSSSQTHCDSTLFVSSSFIEFIVLEEPMLVFHPQLPFQLNNVALEETNFCCPSHALQPSYISTYPLHTNSVCGKGRHTLTGRRRGTREESRK